MDSSHWICCWCPRKTDHFWKQEPQGFILTTILGIIGAFVATYLGQSLGWYQADRRPVRCDAWGSDSAAGLGRRDPFAWRSLKLGHFRVGFPSCPTS